MLSEPNANPMKDVKEVSVIPGHHYHRQEADSRLSIPPAKIASRALAPVEMWKTLDLLDAASRPVMKALGSTFAAASLILSTLTSESPYLPEGSKTQ